MKLHHNQQDFEELIELTAQWRHIPSDAVRKDYFITLLLKNLADSEFVDSIVFKGGTSLTDCSPYINSGGSKGDWDVTDRTGDISKKVEMSFFYFRSIPSSP